MAENTKNKIKNYPGWHEFAKRNAVKQREEEAKDLKKITPIFKRNGKRMNILNSFTLHHQYFSIHSFTRQRFFNL